MFTRNVFVAVGAQLVGCMISNCWQCFEHGFGWCCLGRRGLRGAIVCLLWQALRLLLGCPYLGGECLWHLRWTFRDSTAFGLRGPAALSWLVICFFRRKSALHTRNKRRVQSGELFVCNLPQTVDRILGYHIPSSSGTSVICSGDRLLLIPRGCALGAFDADEFGRADTTYESARVSSKHRKVIKIARMAFCEWNPVAALPHRLYSGSLIEQRHGLPCGRTLKTMERRITWSVQCCWVDGALAIDDAASHAVHRRRDHGMRRGPVHGHRSQSPRLERRRQPSGNRRTTAARQASTGGGLKPEGRSCSGGMLKEWATVDGQRRETLHAGSSRRESFVEQAEASTPLPGPCFTLNSWWD